LGKVIEQTVTETFAVYQADCIQVMEMLPESSVHYSISSPPFSSLYSYTDANEDHSNVRDYAEFFTGFAFTVRGLARVLIPGRLVSFHCMNLPATIERDGYIGIKDFRGDLIRAFQKHGFIFHSEVVIWKDPLVAATRTHAIGLAHQQIVKDSALCRQGIPDYLVTMRKPGKNPEPVTHPHGFDRWIGPSEREPKAARKLDPAVNKYSHYVWQNYASPVWFDIDPGDTLQKKSARDEDDSRHICPLQLTVIRRAVELWSNPGDVVLSPYAGIGSEGYVSLQEGRRFVGAELKDTYYRQAVANLKNAKGDQAQTTIADLLEAE
jgi:DNA modification methylase